jgi:hypothetical protein
MARAGDTFSFRGDPNDAACEGCPVRSLCYRLEPGRHYRVVEVRDKTHPCRLHAHDKVRVCTVEEAPFTSTVEAGRLRGTAVQWSPVPCGFPECPNNALCHPVGPQPGRYEVVDQGAVACPMHYELRKVTLRRLPGG